MPAKDVHVSDLQLLLMRALWTLGPSTTATVYKQVGRPRSLAYTTVATLLARLEKRGLVRSTKDEAGERVFEPLVSEREVTRSMVESLVASLFQGDPRALVSHLIAERDIEATDLETVRRRLSAEDDDER